MKGNLALHKRSLAMSAQTIVTVVAVIAALWIVVLVARPAIDAALALLPSLFLLAVFAPAIVWCLRSIARTVHPVYKDLCRRSMHQHTE